MKKATSGSTLYAAQSSPTVGSAFAYSSAEKFAPQKDWNCSSVSWQRSYSSPTSLSCGESVRKTVAERCCAMRRKRGATRPCRCSVSLRRVDERFVFFAMPSRSVTHARSVSPPACACSCSADKSSSMSMPAILVTRSRSTSSCSDCPDLSVFVMYCSSPTSSIVGCFLYRLPQKEERDCIQSDTLSPSSLRRVFAGEARCERRE
mmetsp:Transcript_44655/g.148038  ORF Transcript_44655/g.148038 Transcript_44655/m.148038 type:complete len:205 (-) Transcript_44655:1518-2132(-)